LRQPTPHDYNQEVIIMVVTFLGIFIEDLLTGGIYALIAVGLSLQYGVVRVLNIAPGEFIMLGYFSTWMPYIFVSQEIQQGGIRL
jgi:branched-subunit amino acid ABC-type transport system permease component